MGVGSDRTRLDHVEDAYEPRVGTRGDVAALPSRPGAEGSRWVPRSSKPVARRPASRGGFDSHALPPTRALTTSISAGGFRDAGQGARGRRRPRGHRRDRPCGLHIAGLARAGSPRATDPAAARQRAQEVLGAWADAVTAAGGQPAVTPVGEATGQLGDWEEAVGDNNKRALMAGLIATVEPLPDDGQRDGEVTWQDGTTTRAPLIPAQGAVVAMESTTEASSTTAPCSSSPAPPS